MTNLNNYHISEKERKLLVALGEEAEFEELTIDNFEQPQGEIDDILEEESYSLEQVRFFAKQDLNFLAGLALPNIFKFHFPPVLLGAWSLLCREVVKVKVFSQVALGIPRGHAKTTLIKIFIVYCIFFTQKKFVLIIGRTSDRAEDILSDVVDMLDEQNIVNTFGSWRHSLTTNRNNLKKFYFNERPTVLAALGQGGSVRGLNINNERPDVIIFDDIQDAEDAKSELVSKQIEDWMIGTAMKAKSPNGCLFIYIGNMFPGKNSILRKLKKNPTWIKFISGAILADNTAIWEELRSKASLIQELENDMSAGKADIFFAEVMNDTESEVSCSVDLTKINPWPWDKYQIPQGKMIIIDPAAGIEGSDPCSIGYFEIYDGIPGLRHLEEGNFSPSQSINKALVLALRTGTKLIACESNAYQATLLFWFNKTITDLSITGIHIVPIYSTNTAKNSRITEMLRSLIANEQAVHEDVRGRVFKQIQEWKPLKRRNQDGILDILTYAPRVIHLYQGLITSEEDIVIQESNAETVIEQAWVF